MDCRRFDPGIDKLLEHALPLVRQAGFSIHHERSFSRKKKRNRILRRIVPPITENDVINGVKGLICTGRTNLRHRRSADQLISQYIPPLIQNRAVLAFYVRAIPAICEQITQRCRINTCGHRILLRRVQTALHHTGRFLLRIADSITSNSRLVESGRPAAKGVAPPGSSFQIIDRAGIVCKHIACCSRRIPLEIDLLQAAISERLQAYAGDAAANHQISQVSAISERFVSNGSNAVGNYHLRQAVTRSERLVANGGDAVGKHHLRQTRASVERLLAYGGNSTANHHLRQASA